MIKKGLSVLFAVVLILGVFTIVPFSVSGEELTISETGASQCGDNVFWQLSDDGVLTLNGSGNTYDYIQGKKAPWYNDCNSIKTVIIGNGITNIGACLFANAENLAKAVIPDSVTSIEQGAFIQCKNLTDITISENVVSIGQGAFSNCTQLQSIVIPDSVIELGNNAFYNCDSLQSVVLSNGLIRIPYSGFCSCDSLAKIAIPDGVVNIDDYAFTGCPITSIVIPDSVNRIGVHAFSDTYITNVVIPDTVTELGALSFFCCRSLKSVVIGRGIDHLESSTFEGCTGLKTIAFSKSIVSFPYIAFRYCGKVETIYYEGSPEEWEQISIDNNLNGNECLLSATKHYYYPMGDSSKIYVLDEAFDHDLTFYAQFWNSTQYNPELAHLMMTFANAAYDSVQVGKGYLDLGLTQFEPYNYFNHFCVYGTENVCYSIASTVADDGTICLLIALRGSGSITDVSQGTLDWLGNLDLGSASETNFKPHNNFNLAANHVYEGISSYLNDKYTTSIEEGNVKYFITGHSRGAAVANLVEYKLEPKVGKQNLFGYNFAVPDTGVVSKETNVKGFNNIFNISNMRDPVSYVPGYIVDMMFSLKQWVETGTLDNQWKKWGYSAWFGYGGEIDASTHDPEKYLEFMRSRRSLSSYTEEPKVNLSVSLEGWGPFVRTKYKLYATYCPVDVELIDTNGKVIASVINGEIDYHGTHFGDVIITTVDDHKMFAVPEDETYTIRIVGSSEGTLDYYVADIDMISEEVSGIKRFEGISLNDGKMMQSQIADYVDTNETQLFLVDNENNKTQEILADGNEVDPIFISESYHELELNDSFTLNADSVDEYIWSSSDESIATVDNGLVKAKSSGTVTIIAQTSNGAKAVCKVTVPQCQYLGDVDGDGEVTIIDATAIQRHLASISTTEYIEETADADEDGEITILDATAIQRHLASLPANERIGLPVEK